MSSFSHHVLLYLRTLYIVLSRVSPGSKLCTTFLKIAKHYKTVAVRLRLTFQFTYVQYCTKHHISWFYSFRENKTVKHLLYESTINKIVFNCYMYIKLSLRDNLKVRSLNRLQKNNTKISRFYF